MEDLKDPPLVRETYIGALLCFASLGLDVSKLVTSRNGCCRGVI